MESFLKCKRSLYLKLERPLADCSGRPRRDLLREVALPRSNTLKADVGVEKIDPNFPCRYERLPARLSG